MLIESPPKWFRALFPGALFRLPAPKGERKRVFLTFDDGPIPEATPWVLDTLDRYDVKATFFMVGENIMRYPHLFEDIRRRGHATGNHTLHHIKSTDTDREYYLEDSRKGATLACSDLFRPPHGWISPGKFRAIKERYTVVMYDLVTRDYSRRISAEEVVSNVKRYTRDGAIIVFHDSLKSINKLKSALPESIEWLKNEGYDFRLIPDALVNKP